MHFNYNLSENTPLEHPYTIDYQYQNTCNKTISIQENCCYLLVCEESDITIQFDLQEENINADIKILCLGTSDTHVTCKSNCIHNTSNTQSHTHMITFCQNQSKATVHGNVTIPQGTKNNSWHLLQENLLLGEHIRLEALPMLDIRTHEVQGASHGAKTHKIDKQKLNYMQSKGITPDIAQQLIIQGYLNLLFEPFEKHQETDIQELKDTILQKILK